MVSHLAQHFVHLCDVAERRPFKRCQDYGYPILCRDRMSVYPCLFIAAGVVLTLGVSSTSLGSSRTFDGGGCACGVERGTDTWTGRECCLSTTAGRCVRLWS